MVCCNGMIHTPNTSVRIGWLSLYVSDSEAFSCMGEAFTDLLMYGPSRATHHLGAAAPRALHLLVPREGSYWAVCGWMLCACKLWLILARARAAHSRSQLDVKRVMGTDTVWYLGMCFSCVTIIRVSFCL
jgi:hypothetical protein